MKSLLRWPISFWQQFGLGGRIVLVILTVLTLFYSGSWLAFEYAEHRPGGLPLYDKDEAMDRVQGLLSQQLVASIRLIEETPEEQHDLILAALSGPLYEIRLTDSLPPAPYPDSHEQDEILTQAMAGPLAPLADRETQLYIPRGRFWTDVHFAIELRDDRWMVVEMPRPTALLIQGPDFGIGGLAIIFIVGGIVVWIIYRMTRPLRLFADAANRLGQDIHAPPLDEGGSRELRHAAKAFNNMATRIRNIIDDRTVMLGALGHDLRTGFTRLRLRIEQLPDEQQRDRAIRDLEEMEAILADSLAFARDDLGHTGLESFDVATLIKQQADQRQQDSKPVRYQGPDSLEYLGRPASVSRIVGNLIDNAQRYGGNADVTLTSDGDGLTITVADDGPGIPETEWENAFRPFYRLETSRNRGTGGTGLGLAIVRAIARSHGGTADCTCLDDGRFAIIVELPNPD